MDRPRILLVSPRLYEQAIWRCGQIEFEDLLCQVADVDLVSPQAIVRGEGLFARQARRVAKRIASAELSFKPRIQDIHLSRDYDLFVFYASQPHDLALLEGMPDWRRRCAKAVCFVDELWAQDLQDEARWVERLDDFDLLAVMFYNTVEPLRAVTKRPCEWVPPGVDTLRFFPGVEPPPRTIDVYAMGRRSEESHRALLTEASAQRWTYLFDTIDPARVRDGLQPHRQQLAELIKRTRYFIANKAKVDAPAHRGVQEELGFRSFEGAAAGAVLLGHTPDSPSLRLLFDWPDAHVHVPFGSTQLADIIRELDADPERVRRIRRDNVVNSLRRHDWAYRWDHVLRVLGFASDPRLQQRMTKLRHLADLVENEGWPPTVAAWEPRQTAWAG